MLINIFRAFLLLGAYFFSLAVAAQPQLLPAQSELIFVSRQMGVPVQGRFKVFSAQVIFDPAQLAASKIRLVVDTASATIAPELDAQLSAPAWFDVARFPKAVFESHRIKRVGPASFEVGGKLSIKGVSRDVVLPVTLTQTGPSTVAAGVLRINRLAFRVGDGEWADTSVVADEVQIKFKLSLSGVVKL